MKSWIRLLTVLAGAHMLTFGFRALLGLPQVALFLLHDNLSFPLKPVIGTLVLVGGTALVVQAVRLIMLIPQARAIQLWLLPLVAVCRISMVALHGVRFPQTKELLPGVVILTLIYLVVLELPLFVLLKTTRVREVFQSAKEGRMDSIRDKEMRAGLKQ
jgi:hypothetical protein